MLSFIFIDLHLEDFGTRIANSTVEACVFGVQKRVHQICAFFEARRSLKTSIASEDLCRL